MKTGKRTQNNFWRSSGHANSWRTAEQTFDEEAKN